MNSIAQKAAAAVKSVAASVTPSRGGYQPVPSEQAEYEGDDALGPGVVRVPTKRVSVRLICGIFLVVIGVVFGCSWLFLSLWPPTHELESCDDPQKGFQCQPDISHFWGQYSPYFSLSSKISPEVPPKCQITFAQILSRHGARDPTADKSEEYQELIEHIHKEVKKYKGKYSFIETYDYTLGADQLSAFGAQQLVNSGDKFYKRYHQLARETLPFIRTSGQQRVVESATNWTKGFHAARAGDPLRDGDEEYPYDIVVLNEGPEWNNTLDHSRCTAHESGYYSKTGDEAKEIWTNIFTKPIRKRLNKHLKGAKLTHKNIIHLMDLCPFETVASPTGTLSPWCSLFSHKEWRQYDYYQSLGKYYQYGWGNPLGATQGVGFTNELLARLTNSPVDDHTSTNSTLDGDDSTFPINKATKLYADFSHDNDLTAIFSAIGLYNETQHLSNTTRQNVRKTKGYAASVTVPFAARAYFEKLRCEGVEEELVRVIVNDRVLPLKTCGGDKLGRCTLGEFVESLEFARNGGHWEHCFL